MTRDYRTAFVSFGDSRMSAAAKRIRAQAQAMDAFDEIQVWNEHDLDSRFHQRFVDKLIIGSQGFGYWCWKPHVITMCLDGLRDGDVALYTDIGCHLRPEGQETLLEFFECARQSPCGVFGFSDYTRGGTVANCAKGDLLSYFGVYDNERVLNARFFCGGVLAVEKRPTALEFLRRWEQSFADGINLIDDTPSKTPNKPGFVKSSHDQASLSILCALYRAASRKSDCFETKSPGFWEAEKPHPIAALRDKGVDNNTILFPRALKVLLGCIPYSPWRKGIGNWYKSRKIAKLGEELKRITPETGAGQKGRHERQ